MAQSDTVSRARLLGRATTRTHIAHYCLGGRGGRGRGVAHLWGPQAPVRGGVTPQSHMSPRCCPGLASLCDTFCSCGTGDRHLQATWKRDCSAGQGSRARAENPPGAIGSGVPAGDPVSILLEPQKGPPRRPSGHHSEATEGSSWTDPLSILLELQAAESLQAAPMGARGGAATVPGCGAEPCPAAHPSLTETQHL